MKKNIIVLLNAEGDILKAEKTQDNLFRVIDQYGISLQLWSSETIYKFTRGEISIEDSRSRIFNYSNFPGSMKPDLKKLDEFIGIDIEGKTY
jgi:hypothetical protein